MRGLFGPLVVGATAAAVTVAGTAAAAAPPAGGTTAALTRAAAGSRPYSVTLVTGDRVTVAKGLNGKDGVTIDRAAGREHVPFTVRRTKTGLTVTPADALPLLAQDRLDARLFDVALLHRFKYDDEHTKEIPLLTQTAGNGGTAQRPPALAGSRVMHTVQELGISVVKQPKKDSPAFWSALTRSVTAHAGRIAAAVPISKVWLNGKRALSRGDSMKQIGAPTAWGRGFSGKGVTVAVLDSGYDQKHPDLAGVVSQSRDFTDSPGGVQDDDGHGTHVASTIAGRGTASKGKYVGVAKDASLVVGRVCKLDGCTDDAILAGMQWAAESGAKVINMSLGGTPTEGKDLLAEAVDELSASKNVLFVVAAGNDGAAETVGSPAIADAALAVGSVEEGDELSLFSSAGPRVGPSRRGDYAIKPDITAPGGDIVAARAAQTGQGLPGAEQYTEMSGTSMAAPHVAGAAALLVQQHPDWKPGQVKAALMSTAKFVADQTVYEQGAGRVDLARATGQSLTAAGSVSMGYFPYGNSGAVPVTRSVTYTNFGKAPVTLKVSLAVKDADGKAAAKGMFTAGASSVTVPAGKTAKVNVTVKPSLGKLSLYSGTLTAVTADGKVRVQTAVGAYKEPKSFNVNYSTINPGPGRYYTELLLSGPNQEFHDAYQGSGVLRLPAGRYVAAAITHDLKALEEGKSDKPTVELQSVDATKTVELVFDARKRKLISQGVDKPAAATAVGGQTLYMTLATESLLTIDAADGAIQAVPGTKTSPQSKWALTSTLIAKGSSMTGGSASPFTYNLYSGGTGLLPAGKPVVHKAAALEKITSTAARQRPDEERQLSWGTGGDFDDIGTVRMVAFGDRTQRTDYLSTSPKTSFRAVFQSGTLDSDGEFVGDSFLISDPHTPVAGRARTEKWSAAVFGPAFYNPAYAGTPAAYRSGDDVSLSVPMRDDAYHAGGNGSDGETGFTRFSAGGKVIHTEPSPGDNGFEMVELPAKRSTINIHTEMNRVAGWRLSKHVELDWTFTSKTGPDEDYELLPLQIVRFRPVLDMNNSAAAGQFSVPLTVQGVDPVKKADYKSITAQVSYDEGKTWVAATVADAGGVKTVAVNNPAGGTVSLRTVVTDKAGSVAKQTIINAYTVRG